VDCWLVSSCMGCPSGPVVSMEVTLPPTLLVVVVLDPLTESLVGPLLSLTGVGVEEGGKLFGVELGLGYPPGGGAPVVGG